MADLDGEPRVSDLSNRIRRKKGVTSFEDGLEEKDGIQRT